MEKYRGRVHLLLLYPDNQEHLKALEKVRSSYDFAGVQHDRDVQEDGELKKAHFHIVIRTQNPTWNTALCKDLGLEERFCEQGKNIDRALQYLIHYNDTNKTQYSLDDVFGPLKTKLVESINKMEKSEGEKVVELLEYIELYEGNLRITEFAKYCARNGYWAEFRRSGAIFCKVIEEKNSVYRVTSEDSQIKKDFMKAKVLREERENGGFPF